MGKYIRAIGKTGAAVCYALESTDMVDRAEKIHQTSAVVTAALGRLMTAASIMGAMLKGEDQSITLRITADGQTGSVIAVADARGNVKGYVMNPVVELPLNSFGKLDVAGAVGKNGNLYVIKDVGLKEPYIGLVPLVSGEIAEDITNYFATSEQIPTACGLGVLVNPDLTVKVAGGYIVQMLPGASEEDISIIEKNIQAMPPVTQMLSEGISIENIALRTLEGMSPKILDERSVEYRCDCTRERVEKALVSLGKDELVQMAEEDGKAEVCCHFCTKKYRFSKDEIFSLIS
ncbi:MAG: Hsp33 family molecular chaperone HslO [Angelakisella sp.]|nr:Hsp33 family molecular chaperone HslO [Angelakisella sp.]